MSDSVSTSGGATPIDKAATEVRETVVRYLVVYISGGRIQNFGFFDATSSEEARHKARAAWFTTSYLNVYHPDHYNEHNWCWNSPY